MAEQEIWYVQHMAQATGRTESAVRSAVARGGADWLPPRLKMRRIAWLKRTALEFLSNLEMNSRKK